MQKNVHNFSARHRRKASEFKYSKILAHLSSEQNEIFTEVTRWVTAVNNVINNKDVVRLQITETTLLYQAGSSCNQQLPASEEF